VSVAERRTTLATVAASAGVSVATVSKVLNGRSDVAPATRARVKELLRTHDYAGHLVGLERRPTVELTLQGSSSRTRPRSSKGSRPPPPSSEPRSPSASFPGNGRSRAARARPAGPATSSRTGVEPSSR